MHRFTICLSVAAAGLGATPAPAFSDHLDSSGAPGEEILVTGHRGLELTSTNETGSRLGLTALETPASVEILPGDTIRARGDLSINDAVTRATGITTTANGGNGGTGLAARGFSGQGSVMQLQDGVRLYPGAGTVTFPFDPWMVERIEVLRGPASVLYGQGAIGGVVNVISRKPTDMFEAEASAGYGSQDTWHLAGGAGGPVGEVLSYRADMSLRGSEGWVNNGRSRSLALSGTLRYAPSDTFALSLSNDYGDQDPMDYYGVPLIEGRFDKRLRRVNYEVGDSVIHYEDNALRLKAEWQPSDAVAVANTAYWLTTDRTWHNADTYSFNPATGLIDRSGYFGGHHDQSQYGDTGSITLKTRPGGLENDIVVGFDVNFIRFKHSNNFTYIDTYSTTSTLPLLDFDPGLFVDPPFIVPAYRTETRQYALFAEDRLKLSDQLSLVGGIRREWATVERFTFDRDAALNLLGETKQFETTLTNTSLRGGIVYQPTPTLSFYGQYATAADPLGSLITTSAAQADFKLATGRQLELGFKASLFDGHGEFTLAAYDIVKKNLLSRDPLSPATVQQIGQRSARGIEASLILPVGKRFTLEANGAVLRAKYDDFVERIGGVGVSRNGKRPPNVPEVTANLWASYSPTKRIQARAGLRYVGATYSDNANTLRLPSYVVVDGGVAIALTSAVSLSASVHNLFDRIYVTNTYNPGQWILGRPRSIDLAVRARF
jgi:iron complex outermembrane receptor protein